MLPGSCGIGLLIITFLFNDHDLKQSGTTLSSDQSPPPITFPALVIPILIFFKNSLYTIELQIQHSLSMRYMIVTP